MEAAAEKTSRRRKPPGKNRTVLTAGGGSGGLLLLGGALAATAALGVAFLVRFATKQKPKKTKEFPHEPQEKTCRSEARGKEAEDGEGVLSPFVPPPPQASPPPPPPPRPPLPQGGEDSISKQERTPIDQNPDAVSASGADDSSATVTEDGTVQGSDLVQVQEKIIEESSPIGGGQEEEKEDLLPAVVNKGVVLDESKIIKVVEEAPPEEPASARAEEKGGGERSPVEDGTQKSSGEAGDASKEEAEPPVVNWPAKAMEPSLPSLGLIHSPKPVAMATGEEVAHGTGEKLGVGVAQTPWKGNSWCVLDRMVVEMKEKGFSKNAQVALLISILFITTLLAIWLHHYSNKLIEESHVEEELNALF